MFSIIICTYNPDKNILNRLFSAVLQLQAFTNVPNEIIVVDNNSNIPLGKQDVFVAFSKKAKELTLIIENRQGLTNARIAGIKKAQYDWLVFFDDDNEPSSDYLINAKNLISKYPEVGAWGPGKVNVEFLDIAKHDWVRTKQHVFQHKELSATSFDNSPQWQDNYPFGTGLVIKKEIALKYVDNVISNKYTLSDRNGKSLSSGGDIQLVLTGIKEGFYAGSSPELSLNHLISSDKANFSYLIRLAYGTASSNLPAHFQVNGFEAYTPGAIQSNWLILKKVYYLYKTVFKSHGSREFFFRLAHYFGELEGVHIVTKQPKPLLSILFEKLLFRINL